MRNPDPAIEVKSMKGKRIRFVGYASFGLLMVAVFLYARFPADAVRDYLIAHLEEEYPGVSLSLEYVKPALPIGLAAKAVDVRSRENPNRALKADEIVIRLSLISLMKGKTSLLFRGTGYGGRTHGTINFPRAFSTAGSMKAEINLEDIDTRNLSALHEMLARQITGKLNASLTFGGRPEKIIEGSGRIKFTILNGTYPLREAVAGIDKIAFTAIAGDVQLSDRNLKINRLNLTGEKLNYSLKGNIALGGQKLGESSLDLTGSVEIRGANKKIPLSVNGTLDKPDAKFI